MIIYMRHGNDEQRRPEFKNDPGIRRDADHDIIQHYRKLVSRYGKPDVIYVSPMRRCIETAKIMGFKDIYIKRGLSRYFLKKETVLHEIDPRTKRLNVPLYETSNEFDKRAYRTIKDIDEYVNKGLKVWVITHSLILKRAAKYYNKYIPKHHDFLEWFIY